MNIKTLDWGLVFNGNELRLVVGNSVIKPKNTEMTNEEIFANAQSFLQNFEIDSTIRVEGSENGHPVVKKTEISKETETETESSITASAQVVKLTPDEIRKEKFGARIEVEGNNNPVYANIYHDVKKNLPDEFDNADVVNILRTWYPNLGEKSLTGYAYAYVKYLKMEGLIEIIGKKKIKTKGGYTNRYARIKKSVDIDTDYLENVGKIEEKVKTGVLN